MSVAGSSTFTDADGYQATLQDMLDLQVNCPRKFNAHLTWIELPLVHLMRAEESSSRVAYLRLPPGQVSVFFATHQGSMLVHGGKEVHFGELIWHNQDGRGHQRTTGACRWGSFAITAETLRSFDRTIADQAFATPAHQQILRPAAADRRELLRAHARAGRIAESSPRRIVNPEVVRALDQELIEMLIACMRTAAVPGDPIGERQAQLCVELEELLRMEPPRLLALKEICQALGVSRQRLAESCRQVIGMGPVRYQRLRRLKLVRFELTRTGFQRPNVPELMARYGFANLYRFITEYWEVYGEMPPIPP